MSDWRSDPNGFNESVINEFRANGGVAGGELAGMSLLLLTTIDARSGQPRTTPLAYQRRPSLSRHRLERRRREDPPGSATWKEIRT